MCLCEAWGLCSFPGKMLFGSSRSLNLALCAVVITWLQKRLEEAAQGGVEMFKALVDMAFWDMV